MAYRNVKDAERRRAYAREYSKKIYYEGKSWAKRNPEIVKIKRRARTLLQYGLTVEEWELLFAKQGFACAVCGSKETAKFGWATDHDHKTGRLRGILCSGCNTAIGQMKDNPNRLRLAADYLEKLQTN